jgi:hypothetical protein
MLLLSREEMIGAFESALSYNLETGDANLAKDMLFDILRKGFIGYNHMTYSRLLELWEEAQRSE